MEHISLRKLLVEISAVVAAIFAVGSYVESRSSSGVMLEISEYSARYVALARERLDKEEELLSLQRGVLASLQQILPETEATRVGIAKLIAINKVRLAENQRRRHLLDEYQENPAAISSAAGSADKEQKSTRLWEQYGPTSTASKKAMRIWRSMNRQE